MINTCLPFRPVIYLFFILFLSSCSHHYRADGPPNFYVDETKIPNATPKPEPLARYGNLPSYRVAGVRYYTMRSSKNYVSYGIASWYGTKFHKHQTSSGEAYNMLAMTAAHKTLPLPTYVQVTNLKNHRKIIVKVNDRGPFAANRIIDLSYVAAKKLNIIGHGTTFVKVEAIDPYTYGRVEKIRLPAPKLRPATFAQYPKKYRTQHSHSPHMVYANNKTKPVYLQVGAFKDKVNAEKYKRHLLSLIKSPINIFQNSQHVYHVQVGPLKDVYTANQMTMRLKRLGIKIYKTGV